MARRLSPSGSPLAYMGVRAVTPAQMVVNKNRRPTTTDLQNFALGTWWIIPTRSSAPTNEVWILINKTATVATWIEIDSGGGSVVPGNQYTLLTADGSGGYGTNVGPGTAGQLLVSGGASANPSYVTPTAGSGLTVTTNASTLEYSLNGPFSVSDGGTGLTSLTIHNLLVGNNTSAVTLVPPNSTAGIPLISNGSGSTPGYGTAVTAGGGTGSISFTAYSVICGGTTSTGALQNVSGVGSMGEALVSQGAGALPQWQTVSGVVGVVRQVITSDGTYTPTVGMQYCDVEILGGGGGGGSAAPIWGSGSGGGAGGYTKKVFTAAAIGASQAVTIGAGGAGATLSVTPGGTGGTTTFGALLTATGGVGGTGSSSNSSAQGGSGGTGSGGDVNTAGSPGHFSMPMINLGSGYAEGTAVSGPGGSSQYGAGGTAGGRNPSGGPKPKQIAGGAGLGYGSGGGGGYFFTTSGSSTIVAGGNGADGVCIITEYL